MVLFATHPAAEERRGTLATAAAALDAGDGRGETHAERYRAHIAPVRLLMVQDELRRRVPDSSLRLFDRLMATQGRDGLLLYARAEALKMRNKTDDIDQALAALAEAETNALPDRPSEALRLRGQILRVRGDTDGARDAFSRYLDLKPGAPDAPMIRSYIETSTP
jgi:Flp pilus assembly protein TadD